MAGKMSSGDQIKKGLAAKSGSKMKGYDGPDMEPDDDDDDEEESPVTGPDGKMGTGKGKAAPRPMPKGAKPGKAMKAAPPKGKK